MCDARALTNEPFAEVDAAYVNDLHAHYLALDAAVRGGVGRGDWVTHANAVIGAVPSLLRHIEQLEARVASLQDQITDAAREQGRWL